MPFNGSGVFERLYDWTDDRDNEINIDADRMDGEHDGFAEAVNAILANTQGFQSGTEALPTINFHSDSDSGLFLESAGVVGLSIAGTKEIEFKAGIVNVINELQIAGTSVSALSRPTRTADGAISAGDILARQSDGTVKAVTSSVGGAETGPNAVFNSGATTVMVQSVAADPNTGKFLIVYGDGSNGYAVVATVAGTSVTFGTPVSFVAANIGVDFCVAFDPTLKKFLIIYKNTNFFAIVCTVSGTTPSFGSAVSLGAGGIRPRLSYDTANNKFLMTYSEVSGDDPQGVVISVSGTTPSFGTPSEASTSSYIALDLVFDATTGKHILIGGGLSSIDAFVGTISGTSVSWGAAQTIHAVDGYNESGKVAGPDANGKYLLAYENGGDSSQGYVVVFSIAGATVTPGTAVEFNDSTSVVSACEYFADDDEFWVLFTDGDNSSYLTSTTVTISGTVPSPSAFTVVRSSNPTAFGFSSHFDATSGVALVAYRDAANSNYGTAFAHTPSSVTTNAGDWFAVAASAAADTETVQVWTIGDIATGLSGLTYGETYYVDIDGTLTTSVTAYGEIGLALSTTDLFITKAGA